MNAPDQAALLACCGSTAWARDVSELFHRQWPHPDPLGAAEEVWWALRPVDWIEALSAHPRIGDRPAAGSTEAREQSAVTGADPAVLAELSAGNRAYEQRFGMTYVVRATGRTAPEMLALLRIRLAHDPDTEVRVAADQQWEITRLRLTHLLEEST